MEQTRYGTYYIGSEWQKCELDSCYYIFGKLLIGYFMEKLRGTIGYFYEYSMVTVGLRIFMHL